MGAAVPGALDSASGFPIPHTASSWTTEATVGGDGHFDQGLDSLQWLQGSWEINQELCYGLCRALVGAHRCRRGVHSMFIPGVWGP